jgi:single-strand DNA-binding protein
MNIVVIQGTLSSDPVERTLPSGETLTSLEVTTRSDGEVARSVPVVVARSTPSLSGGDEVVVVGSVRRRFFRAAGATQSRTEVEARTVVRAGRATQVARLLDSVRVRLESGGG